MEKKFGGSPFWSFRSILGFFESLSLIIIIIITGIAGGETMTEPTNHRLRSVPLPLAW